MSEQTEVEQKLPADRDSLDLLDSLNVEQTDGDQVRPEEVEAIREFLSARNLKTVRNDSSRKSSSCFGRRMDRIGSMSSLGCNTVGKSSKCGRGSPRNLRRSFSQSRAEAATLTGCFPSSLQIQSEVLSRRAKLLRGPYLLSCCCFWPIYFPPVHLLFGFNKCLQLKLCFCFFLVSSKTTNITQSHLLLAACRLP